MVQLSYSPREPCPTYWLTLTNVPSDLDAPIQIVNRGASPCWTFTPDIVGVICYLDSPSADSCTIPIRSGYYYIQQLRSPQAYLDFVMSRLRSICETLALSLI